MLTTVQLCTGLPGPSSIGCSMPFPYPETKVFGESRAAEGSGRQPFDGTPRSARVDDMRQICCGTTKTIFVASQTASPRARHSRQSVTSFALAETGLTRHRCWMVGVSA